MASDPRKPLFLAQHAAFNLGILPQARGARTPAPAAAVPPAKLVPNPVSVPGPRAYVSAQPPPAPAAGGARTAAPDPAAASAQFEQVLNSAKDTNDILALTRLL